MQQKERPSPLKQDPDCEEPPASAVLAQSPAKVSENIQTL